MGYGGEKMVFESIARFWSLLQLCTWVPHYSLFYIAFGCEKWATRGRGINLVHRHIEAFLIGLRTDNGNGVKA